MLKLLGNDGFTEATNFTSFMNGEKNLNEYIRKCSDNSSNNKRANANKDNTIQLPLIQRIYR